MKVYYDSQCTLCLRYHQAVELIASGKIEWLDINDPMTVYPPGSTLEDLLSELHVLREDGTLVRGGDAIKEIITVIPGAGRFSWLIESDSAKRTLNSFYETSERLRQRLLKSCSSCHNKRRNV